MGSKKIMKLKIIGVIFSIFLIIFTIPVIGTEYADFTNKNLSIIVGPYPQSPDIDSIIIIWMTSIATSNNSVHFGLTPVCENIVYDNDTNNFHEIELNGLAPSTKYYFKVIRGKNHRVKLYHSYKTVIGIERSSLKGGRNRIQNNWQRNRLFS